MINYYEILGVDNYSEIDKVKKSYRKLSMTHHPDRGGNEKKFIEINNAYEKLKDLKSKEDYDFELKKYFEELNKPKDVPKTTPKEDLKDEESYSTNNKNDTYKNQKDTPKNNNFYNNQNSGKSYQTEEVEEYEYEEDDDENNVEDDNVLNFDEFKRLIIKIIEEIYKNIRFIFSKNFLFFLKESVNFKGSIGRFSFIKRIIGGLGVFYLIGYYSLILKIEISNIIGIPIITILLLYFLSNIVKRYNDLVIKKWYFILFFIPYINFIMFGVLVFKKGKKI